MIEAIPRTVPHGAGRLHYWTPGAPGAPWLAICNGGALGAFLQRRVRGAAASG